jgi:hypothetical protein
LRVATTARRPSEPERNFVISKSVLSGLRPTGRVHLSNDFGAIRECLHLQTMPEAMKLNYVKVQ